MTNAQGRTSVTLSLPADLAERLEATAEERVVGKALLVEKALTGYLDALPPLNVEAAAPAPSLED